MNYKNAITLLSLLFRQADNTQRGKMRILFRQAVLESDAHQGLRNAMSENTFYGAAGKKLHERCAAVLTQAPVDVDHAPDNFNELERLLAEVREDIFAAETLLRSPAFFQRSLSVVPVSDVRKYTGFYQNLACVICYYLITQHGPDAIRGLTFNMSANFSELADLINNTFSQALTDASARAVPPAWVVRRRDYGGEECISYPGFELEYLSREQLAEQRAGMRAIVPNFYTVNAGQLFDVPAGGPVYVGTGYLVGVPLGSALSLLSGEILLPSGNTDLLGERAFGVDGVLDAIGAQLGTQGYCVDAEKLVSALNRWSMKLAVLRRRDSQRCIFCGGAVEAGRRACARHFRV